MAVQWTRKGRSTGRRDQLKGSARLRSRGSSELPCSQLRGGDLMASVRPETSACPGVGVVGGSLCLKAKGKAQTQTHRNHRKESGFRGGRPGQLRRAAVQAQTKPSGPRQDFKFDMPPVTL